MIKPAAKVISYLLLGTAVGSALGWLVTRDIRAQIEASQIETESFYEEIYCFKAPQGSSEWFAARTYLKRHRPESLTCNFPKAKGRAHD